MNGSNEQEQGATPSGSGCQPTASAAIASSQSGIPSAAADEKLATLKMTLKSDSGFSSRSDGDRISANQWRDIMLVIADAEAYRKMRAADDMLAALKECALEIAQTRNRKLTASEQGALDNARNVIAIATGGAA